MNDDKNKIKECFNKASQTYDQYGHIQQCTGEKLIQLIQHYKHFDHMIDLGCGTGSVSEKLVHQFKPRNFFAIDIADQLLNVAKFRLKKHAENIIESDFETFHFKPILFDLVFSNMSFQWSLDLQKVFLNVYQNMRNGGVFAFSLPLTGTFCELNNKNIFYSKTTLLKYLKNTNFQSIQFFGGKNILKFNSLLSALKSIKAVGANYIFHPSTTKFSKIAIHEKFSLTYQIGYFIASKNT